MPGAIFICKIGSRQKIVKKANYNWVKLTNATNIQKSVFMRVLLKLTKAGETAFCFIRRYHISSVTSMVDGFLQNRQKKSSKILRKNFLDVVCGRFPHLVAIVDIRPDDGGNTVTQQSGYRLHIHTVSQQGSRIGMA